MLQKKYLTPAQALQKLKHFCGYQERSHYETQQKLYSLGLYKKDVEILLSQLIEENYLNEERYATAFAGGRFRIKQWGRVKIKYELQQQPVGDRTIGPTQMRAFHMRSDLRPDGSFVDLDPKPWGIGDRIVGAVQLHLHREQIGVVKPQISFDTGLAVFDPGQIRHGRRQMDRRGGADRAQWIVRHQIDISVRTSPRLSLLR